MYLEAFASSASGSPGGGLVSVLKGWAAEADGAGRLHSLLLRHSGLIAGGGAEAMQRLSRAAELAAIAALTFILTGARLAQEKGGGRLFLGSSEFQEPHT